MSNSNNNRMIVFASILGAILATGLLALNPSPTIANAGAQMYGDQYGYDSNYYYQDDNRYGYDNNHQKKSSHTDIQKIKCVNSNINVNGVDITQIPRDDIAGVAAANEGGTADAANTENGNGLADRINFDRNLVNVCVNANDNEQTRVTAEPQSPEEPITVTATNYENNGDIDDSSPIFLSSATCDTGDIATGGGFAISGDAIVADSELNNSGTGWQVIARGTTGTVQAKVTCLNNPLES